MDLTIAAMLVQDGITSGAIYALLALAMVLVFTVTRVILIPQGELISFGALTFCFLQQGMTPPTLYLLAGLGIVSTGCGIVNAVRHRRPRTIPRIIVTDLVMPFAIAAAGLWLAPTGLGLAGQILLTMAIVTPLGPLLYRIVFEPLAESSVLVLLVGAMAAHVALVGAGLLMFGAEGFRADPLSDAALIFGDVIVSGQNLAVIAICLVLMGIFYVVAEHTRTGRALRATAVNRLGARLVGIPTAFAGRLAFGIASLVGAISGVLIAPITTVYYDTGFLIGLKGFVGAIVGGLASYPAAALAAIVIGVVESLSSFSASSFKEMIVFALIIPVLLWRSYRHVSTERD